MKKCILYMSLLIFIQLTYAVCMDESCNYFGIMGFDSAQSFSNALSLGPSAVSLSGAVPSTTLLTSLNSAQQLGLMMSGRCEGANRFRDPATKKVNTTALNALISSVFVGNDIARHPNFQFYYIIDEPCDYRDWNITLDEFKQIYSGIKAIDPDIPVMVNFADLGCLDNYVPNDCSDWHIADVASFVVTTHKTNVSPNYVQEQAQYIDRAKACNPNIKILALIAVYEYPEKGLPLPSAQWVNQTGMQVLNYDFDGLMYFKWNPSGYMGETIEDVVDDAAYISTFNNVFDAAGAKFNGVTCPNEICDSSENCSTCPNDCGQCQCIENWECTEWGQCNNSSQARNCTGLNNCGTVVNKSAEVRSCADCGLFDTDRDGILESFELVHFIISWLPGHSNFQQMNDVFHKWRNGCG